MVTCFVIAPIGLPDSVPRRRSNGVLDEIVRPAFEPLGYRVERADHDATPGIITEAIIGKLLSAELVVADLTGQNPNVMYELAIRHSFGKPVIMMLEQGEDLPFDIRGQNTVFYCADLAGRSDAIRRLGLAHEGLANATSSGNPVRRTLDVMAVRQEATDKDTLFLDLLGQLRRDVATIRDQVGRGPGENPRPVLPALPDDLPWEVGVIQSLPRDEQVRFIRDSLIPSVRNRAHREWENLTYANIDGKIHERIHELAVEYVRQLGILEAWHAYLRSDRGEKQ